MGIIILFFAIVAAVLAGLIVGVLALLFQSDTNRKGESFFLGFILGGLGGFAAVFAYIVLVVLKDWNG